MNQERKDLDGRVLIAKYSPDGKQVALAGGANDVWSHKGFVQVYDTKTLSKIHSQEHSFAITCLDWSPESDCLMYGGGEGIVFVWRPKADGLLSYMGHSPELAYLPSVSQPKRRDVYSVAWLTDTYVTSAGQDGCVRIWHAESGKTEQMSYSEMVSGRFTYGPGGAIAAAYGMRTEKPFSRYAHAVVYDVQEERAMFSLLNELPDGPCFVWAPRAISRLALGIWGQIQIWDIDLAQQIFTMLYDTYQPSGFYELPAHSIVWSPDASSLACCARWSFEAHSSLAPCARGWNRAVIEIRSTTTGAIQYASVVTEPLCLDWSPDGDQLIVGEADGFEVLRIGD